MSERDRNEEPVEGRSEAGREASGGGQGLDGSDARREEARFARRELLRVGAIGIGASVPAVMTLLPANARAEGSWQCAPGSGASAQGSWQCQGQGANPGDQGMGTGSQDWRTRMREDRQKSEVGVRKDGYVFPGSYEWRMKRIEEREQERRRRGEFSRFGSDEDWR